MAQYPDASSTCLDEVVVPCGYRHIAPARGAGGTTTGTTTCTTTGTTTGT
jgi:hypothetical protein